jgi:GT2 family glycosyltransferase
LVKVSVIIVSWNTREMTLECLASVFQNIGRLDAEVIVVDNASEDRTSAEIARQYPAVRVIENSSNRGFAAANNQAIRVARGEYFLLLNSDTLVRGSTIAASVEYMDERPGVGAMGCRVVNPDGTLQVSCSQEPGLLNIALMTCGADRLPWPRWLGRYQMRHWNRQGEKEVPVISGCFMLVRRSAVEEVGMLDESFFFFGEETDWCMRLRARGWGVRFAPVGEIVHYGSASAVKLREGRSVLLTKALCRLQRKHRGMLAAVGMWTLLLIFNGVRAVAYAARGFFLRSSADLERSAHAWHVVVGMGRLAPEVIRRPYAVEPQLEML